MTPIIRNFLSVIRRYKLAAILNVLGLSVAFAAFMVIMIQLEYDFGHDKLHKDYDKIFRLEISPKGETWGVVCRPLAEGFFESSPHIVAGAISSLREGEIYFHVENGGIRNYYKEKTVNVSPGFTNVFTFDFTEGGQDALSIPGNVIIPVSLARKLFGNEPAVGKQLIGEHANQIIGAVFRDFPSNTVIKNNIYVAIPESENNQIWRNFSYCAYFRVNEVSNVSYLTENFLKHIDVKAVWGDMFGWDESNVCLHVTALQDIHFVTDVLYDATQKASLNTLLILLAIAVVIVAIAAINFTNFSTALTPVRLKSINTQRVLGARKNMLRVALVIEAGVFGLLSCFVAFIIVYIFKESSYVKLVDADLSFTAHPLIYGCTVLIAILACLLAGIYPARHITSFAPALVLKGNFGMSTKGRKMRDTLIGIQYIASFAMIIGASFMFLQNHYMQNSPLGYEKSALITVDIRQIQNNRDALANNIRSYAGIKDITFGESLLSSSDGYRRWALKYGDEYITYQIFPVHHSFLQVMDIDITEGRDFRQEDRLTPQGVYIFNEMARKQFNLELNTQIEQSGGIIGFMPDVKFASFRMAVEPMAFWVWGTENWGFYTNMAYIRLNEGVDLRAAITHIQTTLAGFDSNYPFEVRFFDEVLQRLYEKETALSTLISLFSLIAIFIAIVGVFGLVVFDSECRRKEIGIRKVLGASTTGIIFMFNKAYFRILAICFTVAAPLAWYAVSRWLQNFAYKTPMYWWVYVLAFAAIAVITIATVTFQNWRVASDDPVKAIKSE